jgi:hypothetical protein
MLRTDPWYRVNAVLAIFVAKLLVSGFHHQRKSLRLLAILLFPMLLWKFFLPRRTMLGLSELKEHE